jgi:hypothetical protein
MVSDFELKVKTEHFIKCDEAQDFVENEKDKI